jgi:hypothetical protein
MDEAPVPLSAREKRFWVEILESEISSNPAAASGLVRASAWRRFQSLRWLFLVGGPPDDPQTDVSSGPDLTAIPRGRFLGLDRGHKSRAAKQPKADSAYQRFVRVTLTDRKEEWAGLAQVDRIRRIGAEWSALSKEEKQAFGMVNIDA